MSDAWRTRSGQEGEGQLPGAGDDLAAVQRQLASRRGRASVEEEAARQAAARKARLESRSSRQRMTESLADRRIWIAAGAIVAIALFILVALPAIRSALNPPMSREALDRRTSQLQLSAERALGVAVGAPRIEESPQAFTVTYRAPAGAKRFQGGFTSEPCSLTLTVSRESEQVISRRQQGCR